MPAPEKPKKKRIWKVEETGIKWNIYIWSESNNSLYIYIYIYRLLCRGPYTTTRTALEINEKQNYERRGKGKTKSNGKNCEAERKSPLFGFSVGAHQDNQEEGKH
jgi:predicted component of type VI protein secretion system